ncbi:MAG TPA: NADP-dependent malic enzyme [Candidatus Norongarragalinales archaeon]|nr:NADP-dependent malic enzyme [Candidatus Norongarragalinales archaeon]
MPKTDYYKASMELHLAFQGKLSTESKVPLKTKDDLSIAYTPGVAEPCRAIAKNPQAAFDLTIRGNTIAVVSDGSAVLGLGNIGGPAALPVMEGKALLFKEFGGVNAFPICVNTQDPEKIIELVCEIAPNFGGINLEDIASPHCFQIEDALKKRLDIPVFHDDQHGTAIVVMAALINACQVTGKKFSDLKVAFSGAGAAGLAVSRFILGVGRKKDAYAVHDVILCDSKGIVSKDRNDLNWAKAEIAKITNRKNKIGTLAEAMQGADAFIGVSVKGTVRPSMVRDMNRDAIVLAMANPEPEIWPDDAKKAGARIVGTGRSDLPNQINNVLAFPGMLRGALDAKAVKINEEMKLAAALAIAGHVKVPTDEEIVPSALDRNVGASVAKAVADAAIRTGVIRKKNS